RRRIACDVRECRLYVEGVRAIGPVMIEVETKCTCTAAQSRDLIVVLQIAVHERRDRTNAGRATAVILSQSSDEIIRQRLDFLALIAYVVGQAELRVLLVGYGIEESHRQSLARTSCDFCSAKYCRGIARVHELGA